MKKIALLAYPLVAVVSLAAAGVVFAGTPAPQACPATSAEQVLSAFAWADEAVGP